MVRKWITASQKASVVANIHAGNRLRRFLHHLAEFKSIQLQRTDGVVTTRNVASLELGARCAANGLEGQIGHLLTCDTAVLKCVLHNLEVIDPEHREHEHPLRL